MNSLYVYNSTSNINISTDETQCVYYLDTGKLCNPELIVLNDADKLHEIALELKQQFCDYVYSLNKVFLEEDLIYEKDLSLYFISDLSNKRTEYFDTYVTICHLMVLKNAAREYGIDIITVDGCTDVFVESLRSAFPNVKIVTKNITKLRTSSFIRENLTAGVHCIACGIAGIVARMLNVSSLKDRKATTLYFVTFPKNMNEYGESLKYADMVRPEDGFLCALMTDGMHQRLSFSTYVRAILRMRQLAQKRVCLVLDQYIYIKDCINSFIRGIEIFLKKRRLRNKNYVFNGIIINGFIKQELDVSFKRIVRLLLLANAYKRILSFRDIKRVVYFLHEYSFGRFLTYMLAKYFPQVERVGFQHGPASRRKLLYALGKDEAENKGHDYINHLPIPERVLCEDTASKSIYEEAGYKNVEIMPKTYRLNYLKTVVRDNVKKDTVLIACGLHDGALIFESLKEEIAENKNKLYYFKLHPKAEKEKLINDISKSGLKNIEFADKHITDYLSFVEEVIVTYSSVGYEAHVLGIKTRVLKTGIIINESPLLDMKEGG